ncbi:MAG: DEAD/DEAH box helicase, partial [bacterium]
MQLQDREILNKYLLSLFGVEEFISNEGNFKTLRQAAQPDLIDDGFDEEGKSYILQNLLTVNFEIEDELFNKLETYDNNIREYVEHISENRENMIDLKYFQYFAVLFTEIFLDRYFNSKEKFLVDINEFVDKENKKIKKDKRKYSYFEEDDLNKLAYYMATGSGKTLIMHINFLQFLKYNDKKLDNIILITPNERLTKQHIEEFKVSNIDVDHLNNMGGGLIGDKDIYVIE